MRVFLAGATGAIGRELVPQLLDAGHEVTGMTRSDAKAGKIRESGAEAAVCDALDAEGLRRAVVRARPQVVIGQLTDLPAKFSAKIDYGPTSRLRIEGGRNLAAAARAAGAERLVTQSIAFLYAPGGQGVCDEESRVFEDAPAPFDRALHGALAGERATLEAEGLEGVILRYGWFYGHGTYYAPDGGIAGEVRKRRFPIVGDGGGVNSFIHIGDAAAATVSAVESGARGIFNVCDDDPAAMADWLPIYARALGARPPRRIPVWMARLLAGRIGVHFTTRLPGASNEKAKRELGWTPRFESWRQGFHEALG